MVSKIPEMNFQEAKMLYCTWFLPQGRWMTLGIEWIEKS